MAKIKKLTRMNLVKARPELFLLLRELNKVVAPFREEEARLRARRHDAEAAFWDAAEKKYDVREEDLMGRRTDRRTSKQINTDFRKALNRDQKANPPDPTYRVTAKRIDYDELREKFEQGIPIPPIE